MTIAYICMASPIQEDRSETPTAPDFPLIFYNDQLLPFLRRRARDKGIRLRIMRTPTLSVRGVLSNYPQDEKVVVAIFGHSGLHLDPPTILNRRDPPHHPLISPQLFTQLAHTFHIVACHSLDVCAKVAGQSCDTAIIGYLGLILVPEDRQRLETLLQEKELRNLVNSAFCYAFTEHIIYMCRNDAPTSAIEYCTRLTLRYADYLRALGWEGKGRGHLFELAKHLSDNAKQLSSTRLSASCHCAGS